MTIHLIAMLNIKDADKLTQYREKAAAALAKHGGTVVQASMDLGLIEGNLELPQTAAILGFKNKEAAQAWKNDPDLQEVHQMRQSAGDSKIFMMG